MLGEETTTAVTEPTIPAQTTAEPAPTPPPPPPPPENRREFIKHHLENAAKTTHAASQPRDKFGKFNGPPTLPKADPAAAPAVPPVQRPDMPKSLKAELRQHWDAAPVDLLADIVRREADFEKGIGTYKSQLGEWQQLFQPYDAMLKAENATPRAAVENLLQTAAILRTGNPVQKAQLAAQMMRQFGIPFEQVQQLLSGQGAPAAPGNGASAIDPQVSQHMIRQQVQQSLAEFQQQQRIESSLSLIQEFSADPANKFYQQVEESILDILGGENFQRRNADKSAREKLKLAYEAAIRQDPEVSAQLAAEAKAAEAARTQVQQARNAAVQVSGAPASGPAPPVNPKDRRAIIAQAVKHAQR